MEKNSTTNMEKPPKLRFLRILQRSRKFNYALQESGVKKSDVILFMRDDVDYLDAVNRAMAQSVQGNELAALEKKRAQLEHLEECFEKLLKLQFTSLSDAQCMKRCGAQFTTWKKDLTVFLVYGNANKTRVSVLESILSIRSAIIDVSNQLARMADYKYKPARERDKPIYSVLSVKEIAELGHMPPRPTNSERKPKKLQCEHTHAFIDFGKYGVIEFPIKPSMYKRIAKYPSASEYHIANCYRTLKEYNVMNVEKTTNAIKDILTSLIANGEGSFAENFIKLRTFIMGEDEEEG